MSTEASRLAAEFEQALGSRLAAVYRYGLRYAGADGETGGGRLLVVIDSVNLQALRLAGPVAVKARKSGMPVRMDTAHDLLRAADTHPVLTMTLMDSRELLAGTDVLMGMAVKPGDMRLRVEQSLRGLLHELTDDFLWAPRNEVRLQTALRRCGARLIYLLAGLLVVKGELEQPRKVGGLGGADAIIERSAVLLGADEREALAALQAYARHEHTLTGDGIYALFDSTLELLKTLVRHADTHH